SKFTPEPSTRTERKNRRRWRSRQDNQTTRNSGANSKVAEIQYYGTGRRKSATARVYLRPGSGNFKVNRGSLDSYFKNETLRMIIRQPLQLTDTLNKFDVLVNVDGGGVAVHAGAGCHRLSRSPLESNAQLLNKFQKA